MRRPCLFVLLSPALLCSLAFAQKAAQVAETPKLDTSRGDRMLAEYFRSQTQALANGCLAEIKTLDDWNARKGEYRRQLLEMLGLDPLPEKTDLKAQITGRVEHDEFIVEKVHFQSRPGLYVTGNLYLPRKIDRPLPTILYVCGHGRVVKDGVVYGAKVSYQHHGAWFAKSGYACLTIDTLQLGEIEGIHHGTHRYGMWWWLNRGYTPAGVEAWNCVRALDYLETRKEVDATRFGVTGRSGGGAYSWWIAAIDDRIKVAVPVAGITDLTNHVVDGTVEGHCDCMFMVNTYRWDYAQVAALVAPRPLLISNTDSDGIFPLDGVYRTFEQVRRIYRLHESAEKGATAKVALNISPGPHKDTQELQVHAFRWFNHYLKGDDSPVEMAAVKFFQPEQLKVFATLPADEINTKIHESFVPAAAPAKVPADKGEWEAMRGQWQRELSERAFRSWPQPTVSAAPTEILAASHDGIRLAVYEFESQPGFRLRLYTLNRTERETPRLNELNVLTVLDNQGWNEFLAQIRPAFESELKDERLPAANVEAWQATKKMLEQFPWVMTYVAPRGVGPSAWDQSERKQIQHRRRFYLLGQTLDAQQVWDVRRAVQSSRSIGWLSRLPIWLQSHRTMAGVALYAGVSEPEVQRLDLYDLPKSHRDGPIFLNVNRYLDMPQAVAMAAERSKVVLYQDDDAGWEYPQAVAQKLGWDARQIQIRRKVK
jgi:dienelactone hydrolase